VSKGFRFGVSVNRPRPNAEWSSLAQRVESMGYDSLVMPDQEIATIDTLSDGRFDFGIGTGWLKSEYDAAGLRPFCRRSSGSGRRPGNASIGSC
jgi:alkanesulfonate monooxygenase SsuD/methylene tetrahydromethanopterin reductase-like flavin-dependent oxidoreductase (luciferase family)